MHIPLSKTKMEPHGVQYTLVLHLLHENKKPAEQFKAFFSEIGTTGVRETIIHCTLLKEAIIESADPRWMRDLYEDNRVVSQSRGLPLH